jgi:hypothetical protein
MEPKYKSLPIGPASVPDHFSPHSYIAFEVEFHIIFLPRYKL